MSSSLLREVEQRSDEKNQNPRATSGGAGVGGMLFFFRLPVYPPICRRVACRRNLIGRTDAQERIPTMSPAMTLGSALNGNPLNPGIVIWTKAHYLGIASQRIVNNAPVVRIHRLQFNRASGGSHRFGDLL